MQLILKTFINCSIIFIFCVLIPSPLNAESTKSIDIANHANGDHTGSNYYYLIDESNQLELTQAIQSPDWQIAKPGIDNRGLSTVTSWMKFTLRNSSTQDIDIVLAYVDHAVTSIDFYQRNTQQNTQFNKLNFTFNQHVDSRPVPYFRPAFPVSVPAQESIEIYVKLDPGNIFPMHTFTSFRIWDQNAFYSMKDKELIFLIILLCVELFMALVTLLFFLSTRDKVFLFYSIFALSAISLFASVSGIWGYLITKNGYELWHVVLQVSISQIAALFFVRVFLETKKHLPKIDKFLQIIIAFAFIGIILNLLGQHYYSRNIIDYTSLCFLSLIPIGLLAYRKGIQHSALFTLSWVVFIAGMATGALRLRGHIPDTYITEWIIYVGGLIEISLLLTILILRLNKLAKEKELAESLYRSTLEDSAKSLSLQVEEKTQALQDAKIKAENEARIDILTNLTNRRAFLEIAERALARAKRNSETKLYLALIDVDYFKQVNDSYGHSAGDMTLKHIAKTLSENTRETEVISRIGGEEFSVIIENSKMEQAKKLAEKLRLAIENTMTKFQGDEIKVTISVGLAEYKNNQTLDTLLNNSDKALYTAKQTGRNNVVVAEPV